MGLKAPIHQTCHKFVNAMVGTTNPLQVCGRNNGHKISWTPITKQHIGCWLFCIVITRKQELFTTIITKKKKVGFLKGFFLQAESYKHQELFGFLTTKMGRIPSSIRPSIHPRQRGGGRGPFLNCKTPVF
jgi:hypothetical protein